MTLLTIQFSFILPIILPNVLSEHFWKTLQKVDFDEVKSECINGGGKLVELDTALMRSEFVSFATGNYGSGIFQVVIPKS